MKRETICLIIACLISFILTAGIMNWRMEIVHAELSDTQQSLAKEVFRFHVIAESDSANDQRIKLKVRDAVLKYMKAHMTRAERRDAKATKVWTLTHKKELTDTADKILKKEKVSYRAKAEVPPGLPVLCIMVSVLWKFRGSIINRNCLRLPDM